MKAANISSGIFSSRHHGPGLVERAFRAEHPLIRLGSDPAKTYPTLRWCWTAARKGVFHAAAVEAANRLEFVESR
jgi:hypothetical protein